MPHGDRYVKSSRSNSFSDAFVVDEPVAKADDELSETEIEDDDDEGTLASPNAAQLTAESCSTWASVRDQSIFEIFDRIEKQRPKQRWRPSQRLRTRRAWLNLDSESNNLSSFVME